MMAFIAVTNRKVREDASAVFHGMGCFTFMDTTQHQSNLLELLVDCIGPVNASHLTHACINFPVVESVKDQPGRLILKEDDPRQSEASSRELHQLDIAGNSRAQLQSHDSDQDESGFGALEIHSGGALASRCTTYGHVFFEQYRYWIWMLRRIPINERVWLMQRL